MMDDGAIMMGDGAIMMDDRAIMMVDGAIMIDKVFFVKEPVKGRLLFYLLVRKLYKILVTCVKPLIFNFQFIIHSFFLIAKNLNDCGLAKIFRFFYNYKCVYFTH